MNVGILILGRKRAGFDPEWGAEMVAAVNAQLDAAAFPVFRPSVSIVDDASLRAALVECEQANVDVVVALQPTMGDGNLALTLGQCWQRPVVLWATPEKPTGSMISSCSLVGAHVFAATLRQLALPFELVYGMPGEAKTVAELETALRLATALPRLQASKVGLIGYHAPGFVDMEADPFELRRELGVSLRHIAIGEFREQLESYADDVVAEDVQRVVAMGLPMEDVTVEDLALSSRYYLALRDMIDTESLDALAVRCWPELPGQLGQWPYLAFVRLAEEGASIACEGDVDGAVSTLLASLLGFGDVYLSDWLSHDRDTITIWHGGAAPLGLCDPVGSEFGPRIARHFNNKKPAVVNANIRADMPITVFRLWRCDGEYRMVAFEGQTLEPRQPLLGSNGLALIPELDVEELFDELVHVGMPHHVAVVAGPHARALTRWARMAGVQEV
jgi:L-fucose isomerase-like protein